MSPSSDVGYFSEAARQSAISAALPLVATYFQKGGQLAGATATVGESGQDDEPTTAELLDALRLRVALASASRLQAIAAEVVAHANFRYATRREEAVGAIRGRLDLHRVIRETGRLTVPPRYPVITVSRSSKTPENVLLASALMWVRHELRLPGTRRLSPKNAESRARDAAIYEIDRALAGPALHECRQSARERLDRGQIGDLCAEVERRIAGGHAISPAYGALLEWMQRCLSGQPAAEPGEIEWSFYGAEFDTRLFEIWILGQLRMRLLRAIGANTDPWDYFSDKPAIDITAADGVRVRLVHQTSIRKLRGDRLALRWRRTSTKPLGEIPDFLVALDFGGSELTLVLDAKLRRRKGAPTEEIYKLLGYFNNYAMDAQGAGAIFYYAQRPDVPALFEYQSDAGGAVVAISLDPERPDSSAAGWDALMDLVTSAIGKISAERS